MILPDKKEPLKDILYISIPDDFEQQIGVFSVDPSILLPVEVPGAKGDFEIQHLSWEQVAAALCKIIAWDPDNKDSEYYKNFLLAIRPDIEKELSIGGVEKATQKEYDIAEELFLILKNLYPDKTDHRLNLALAFESHGNLYEELNKNDLAQSYKELAFREYSSLLKIAPESPDVQFNAGHFFFKNLNYERALTCFRQYLKHGKDEKRIELLKEIIEKLDKQFLEDKLFKEAYDLIMMGEEKRGLEKIESFLASQPEVWNGWFLKGWALRRLSEFQPAKEAFKRAVDLSDPNVDILNELAICAMELEEYAESREYLKQALTKEPENIKIISNLGILSMKKGEFNEAAGFFRTVLDIDDNDEIAKKYLNYIEDELSK